MAVIERWCCWASTSVGASRAAWPPESTTWSIARSATTVLPEPTSPCSSRCIGWPSAELVGDLLPHAALAVGQGERQPFVEPVEDAPRSAGAGVGDRGLDRRPTTGEHGLRDEGLVVLEPLLGRDLLAPVVRPVDPAQRLVDLDEVLGLTHLRGAAPRGRRRRGRARAGWCPRTARCSRRPRRRRAGSGRASRRGRCPAPPYILEAGLVSCHSFLNHFSRPLNTPTLPTGSSWVARHSAVFLCLSKYVSSRLPSWARTRTSRR